MVTTVGTVCAAALREVGRGQVPGSTPRPGGQGGVPALSPPTTHKAGTVRHRATWASSAKGGRTSRGMRRSPVLTPTSAWSPGGREGSGRGGTVDGPPRPRQRLPGDTGAQHPQSRSCAFRNHIPVARNVLLQEAPPTLSNSSAPTMPSVMCPITPEVTLAGTILTDAGSGQHQGIQADRSDGERRDAGQRAEAARQGGELGA